MMSNNYMDNRKGTTFLEILTTEINDLAENFGLSDMQTEEMQKFVTLTALRAWKNGRNIGWLEREREKEKINI